METKNIMIVGVGGQGTLLTSRILGGIITKAGYDVKLSEVHGMAQRGGSVIAFEKLEALRYAHFLKKDGVMIVNEQEIAPMTVVTGACDYPDNIIDNLKKEHKVVSINAMDEAKKLGNTRCFNVVILGLAAKSMDFDKDEWLSVIADTVPKKTIDINQKAFIAGFES